MDSNLSLYPVSWTAHKSCLMPYTQVWGEASKDAILTFRLSHLRSISLAMTTVSCDPTWSCVTHLLRNLPQLCSHIKTVFPNLALELLVSQAGLPFSSLQSGHCRWTVPCSFSRQCSWHPCCLDHHSLHSSVLQSCPILQLQLRVTLIHGFTAWFSFCIMLSIKHHLGQHPVIFTYFMRNVDYFSISSHSKEKKWGSFML